MGRRRRLALSCLLVCACGEAFSGPPSPVPELPAPNPSGAVRYLALGDSYTIGQGVSEPERWPNQLGARLEELDVQLDTTLIIAMTGWRTDDLLSAVDDAGDLGRWDLVSVLIGVNDQFQGRPVSAFRGGLEVLIARAIGLTGGDRDRVFVLSIPDYGFTPFGESNRQMISPEIDTFNSAARQTAKDAGVAFLDITPLSRLGLVRPEYVSSDGLHPSGAQYADWVDLIYLDVASLLRD